MSGTGEEQATAAAARAVSETMAAWMHAWLPAAASTRHALYPLCIKYYQLNASTENIMLSANFQINAPTNSL